MLASEEFYIPFVLNLLKDTSGILINLNFKLITIFIPILFCFTSQTICFFINARSIWRRAIYRTPHWKYLRAQYYHANGATIKRTARKQCPTVSVTLSRTPGEVIHPLQNANFQTVYLTDLYITISCFADSST